MPPIGPMGAASALSRRVNGDDSADAGVVGLLSEMADHVDSADWQLIVGAIVCAFSFSLFIGFGVLPPLVLIAAAFDAAPPTGPPVTAFVIPPFVPFAPLAPLAR